MPTRAAQKNAEEQILQKRTGSHRYVELDALRGIAAVTVVTHHLRFIFWISPLRLHLLPLLPLDAGFEAVSLFFVLSGYVLSLPFWSGRKTSYAQYVVRRFMRIYIPFFVASLLSVGGDLIFGGTHLPVSEWFYNTWQQPITGMLLAQQFLMYNIFEFNTAVWSLGFEMEMSFILPALVGLLRRNAVLVTGVLFALGYYFKSLPFLLHAYQAHYSHRTNYVIQLVQVAADFSFGATLAYKRDALAVWVKSLRSAGWLVLLASLVLFYSRSLSYSLALYPPLFFWHPRLDQLECMPALGAAGIILCALNLPGFSHVLRHTVPEYLGRISYSLYLTHSIILFSFVDMFYGHMPTWLMILLILAGFGVAAHLFCIYVEEPSIRLGKQWSKRFASPAVVPRDVAATP